jgi:AraC-like DNA-binding protein
MSNYESIRLSEYPDKTLIINAYHLDPTIHKKTLADGVIGCSYEYVRRLFAELSGGNLPEEEAEEVLNEEVQRELARRLLAHGAEVGTDLEVDVDDLKVDPIPPAKLDDYVVPASSIVEVRDTMADTRELMTDMGDEAGEAVAKMVVEKLDELMQDAHRV